MSTNPQPQKRVRHRVPGGRPASAHRCCTRGPTVFHQRGRKTPMRTVFCQKPCCQGTQVWTQQVQGLHPPPSPTASIPSKVCCPGMTGHTLGHQVWATAAGRSRATARSGAWLSEEPRKSPLRRSLLWPPVPPPGSLEAPSAPRARGAWPAHHAVHHADVARVPAEPAVHVPAEAVQAAEARGPPGHPAAVGDLQGGWLTSGVQTWASPHNPTPPAPGVQRTREPGSGGHGQSCRDCCVRAVSTS